MNKNENTRNLEPATTATQTSARAPEKDKSDSSSGSLDGRIEKRISMAVPVDLVIAEDTLIAERVVTVNVSPHGVRVVSKRRWLVSEQPWFSSLTSYFRLQGSVVYCQPLTNGEFGVGLKFRANLSDLGDRLWP